MERDDAQILEAVIGLVSRYGIKRATTDELARHAGVSRQTLYDKFGGKDEVLSAAIAFMARRLEDELRDAMEKRDTLSGKIDAFFEIGVMPVFDVLQNMPDAADLERGLGPKSTEAGHASSRRKQAQLAVVFAEHLPSTGQSPDQVAAFFEESCHRAKMSNISREELVQYLAVLKSSVLALARG